MSNDLYAQGCVDLKGCRSFSCVRIKLFIMTAKSIIVTGASRGIGKAIAIELIKKFNNNVVAISRTQKDLINLKQYVENDLKKNGKIEIVVGPAIRQRHLPCNHSIQRGVADHRTIELQYGAIVRVESAEIERDAGRIRGQHEAVVELPKTVEAANRSAPHKRPSGITHAGYRQGLCETVL